MENEIEGISTPLEMVAAALREPDGLTVARCDVILTAARERVADLGRRIGDERDFQADPSQTIEDAVQAEEGVREYEIELAKLQTALSQLTALRDQRQQEETAAVRAKVEAVAREKYDAAHGRLMVAISRLPELIVAIDQTTAAHKEAVALGLNTVDPDDMMGGHVRAFQIVSGIKDLIARNDPVATEHRKAAERAKAERMERNRIAFEIETAARERVARQMVEAGMRGPLDAEEIAAAKTAIIAERSARQLPPLPTQEKAA